MAKNNIPRHVGFIPDGNRRWAMDHDIPKEGGYAYGINPGLLLLEKCKEVGIKEVSIYCFTQDNTKRPSIQTRAFSEASVTFALEIARRGAALLVVGDETSKQFPEVLKKFRQRQGAGIKVNLLVNYGWEWDLAGLKSGGLRSDEISRLDLIVRWGGWTPIERFSPGTISVCGFLCQG
ncbi:undecaprenyl diphosphate synthase [Onishia taeanensis]|uniref:Undecaprenyl diphosphate synthase n=1 Tax=Onishia taeanensis TaxID=284577 RepID=A0A328XXY3_9GAMM|nr:undecaprenyl diphosphate synthase family protein [Halomonas taeanensis]RAR61432.1 undecaprenyl diphosphate synthase [Halomonas taeanensis]